MVRERNPWLALSVLCLGFFVILLDTTIVNVAIPTMLDSLHASLDQILWVVNAYMLAFAVLLVTGGRLGDMFGPRNLFIIGLAGFVGASALCGLSQNANQLIAARVLQGVFGAVLSPQTLSIVATIFPANRRGAALGILSAVTAIAALLGPLVGGFLVTDFDWRWIFFVNVPIGGIGIVLAWLLVPDLRPGRLHRLDLVGVALVSAGLFAVVFGLIEGQRYNWSWIGGSSLTISEVIGAGVVLLAMFLLWERFQTEPLLPLEIFRNRNYSIMVWLFAMLWFALVGLMLTGSLFFQSVLGMSAIQSGLTVTPITLVMAVVAPFAGRLTDRIGGRYILLVGFLLAAGGMAGVASVESLSASSWTFALPLAAVGFGMGCVIAPLTTEAMREVPARLTGAASGMLNASRQLGSVVGLAVIGAILQSQLVASMASRATIDAEQLPPPLRVRFVNGFANAGSTGLQVGRGQTGAQLPSGLTSQDSALVERLVHDVFVNAFSTAMRPTILVAAAALLVAAFGCLFIIGRRRAAVVAIEPSGSDGLPEVAAS